MSCATTNGVSVAFPFISIPSQQAALLPGVEKMDDHGTQAKLGPDTHPVKPSASTKISVRLTDVYPAYHLPEQYQTAASRRCSRLVPQV
jgi:hypothetical protein